MIWRNSEGYYDPTAGGAIKNIMKEERTMEIMRGDIYYTIRNNPESDIRQAALVISNDNNSGKNVVIVNLWTKKPSGGYVADVMAKVPMVAMCKEIYTCSKDSLTEYVRTATDEEMNEVDRCIKKAIFGTEAPETESTIHAPQPCTSANDDDRIRTETERNIYKNLYEQLLERMVCHGM